jgi:hypothetical protein
MQWRKYPNRPKHLARTRANIVHDLMMDKAINRFDRPRCRVVERRNQTERFLVLDERVALWFKKLDRSRVPRNYPTEQALKRSKGQLHLFGEHEDLELLVVGYALNREQTAVTRVSITKPNGRARPSWFIDLDEPTSGIRSLPNPSPQDEGPRRQRIVIKKGPEQQILGS